MDSKQKNQLMIVGALVAVFALVFANSLRQVKAKLEPTTAYTQATPGAGLHDIKVFKGQVSEPKKEEREVKWGRDPFVLQEASQGAVDSVASLKLMGIITGTNSKPKAIINNEILSVGSKLGKFTLKGISKNKVVVSDGEKDYDLNLL